MFMRLWMPRFGAIVGLCLAAACTRGSIMTGTAVPTDSSGINATDTPPTDKPPAITPPADTSSVPVPTPPASDTPSNPALVNYFGTLSTGTLQRALTCSRGNADRFALWYCAAQAPAITSLVDVLKGLTLRDNTKFLGLFAVVAASTALDARSTSVLNPTAVIYSPAVNNYVAVAFARGSNIVEVAAFDPKKNDLNFYLVRYEHPCDANRTCTNADRFLPGEESGWVNVTAYGDVDLKNSALDCLQCHEPQGHNWSTNVGTRRILRMQELVNPWTHWLRSDRGSSVLLTPFRAAHKKPDGSFEDYAGIPGDLLFKGKIEANGGDPLQMQTLLIQGNGFGASPNVIVYKGNAINGDDPNFKTPDAAWLPLFQQALDGAIIFPPYFGIDPYDRIKVDAAIKTYQDVAAGTAPRTTMPDMGDLYMESARPFVGFVPPDTLNGKAVTATQIIAGKCAVCHNGKFPGISRNNFNFLEFPGALSSDMKAKVIERINLPNTSALRMPPAVFSDLTAAQKQRIADALK